MKSSYFRLAFAVACTGILVNAAAAQTVQFETSSLLVNGTSMTVNVIITSAPSTPVTVQIGTLDGTAFSPGDYTAASGTLVFPAGSISPQSFTVAGINT
ncbi:MAG: hypothetical protein HY289_13265, partial [Planctomycetes bacterium]|nr:hypothetical protein [Planctomycetota bacterium]